MKGKYREAESIKEIESILKVADATDCIIWQNINGERVVYDVIEVEYKEENRETKFKLNKYQNDFDARDFVYIKMKYRGTMFKTSISEILGSYITVSNPINDSVKTIELRNESRVSFDLNEETLITMSIIRKEVTKGERILRFQISDISESGICLLVSNQNRQFIEDSREIYITHLGSHKLEEPMPVIRQYTEDFRFKKLGKNSFTNRVGFKLDEKFDPRELKVFLDKRDA